MRYVDLVNELVNKILYSPSKKNFITTNYSNAESIKQIILSKFPEFSALANEEEYLDNNALNIINKKYDIELNYKIQEAEIIDKILVHCINKNYDINMFITSIALLEDIMINGTRELFGHHILTMEYVIKAYVDNFIDEYTDYIVLANDEEESNLVKFACIVKILNDPELYNMLVSQASSNILINWLSDFNDLLLLHYRNTSLEQIREDTRGMVSYVVAEVRIFSVNH